MDPLQVILRILHIGCGVFWVGSDLFATFILIPRLRALGSDIERPVMASILRVLPPVLVVCSVTALVTGIVLAGDLWGWSLAGVFATGWGWAMLIGFILTIITMLIGFALMPMFSIRVEKINREAEGRAPSPHQARQLASAMSRIVALARSNSIILVIVIGTMAVARFV
jgi:hypothetical protein